MGTVFYRDSTPHPPNFQVVPAAQVKQRDPSGAGASGRAESQGRADRNWLESSQEAVMRWASEGSLSLMVERSLNVEQNQRGGGGGGDHENAGKGGGGGPRRFSREDIRRGSI